MSRSPLAYPLSRSVDGDAGGAADLQTDIMRFMAILALCLVAIFALVQSIPLAPQPLPVTNPSPPETPATEEILIEEAIVNRPPEAVAQPVPEEPQAVHLTRPKWKPLPRPERAVAPPVTPPEPAAAQADPEPAVKAAAEPIGFTLRFESDLALTRLVAANRVGFYAITAERSQRMAVSDSRISFWDASTPNSFHEMEAATVPDPVIKALQQTGIGNGNVDWGVTLPGKLSRQLQSIMSEHDGGSLIIGSDGQLRLEVP